MYCFDEIDEHIIQSSLGPGPRVFISDLKENHPVAEGEDVCLLKESKQRCQANPQDEQFENYRYRYIIYLLIGLYVKVGIPVNSAV